MGYKRENSPWDALNGQLEAIKRRALDRPIDGSHNEQGQLKYLGTTMMFRLSSKEADEPFKELDGWKPPFMDEVAL
jgi:hypothetical protein